MKKVLTIVLSLIIIIGLAGCIIGLTNKESNKESSKESVNNSSSYEDEVNGSSSTGTPSDSSTTLPEDSSSSGEEVDENINYTVVYDGTEFPMTTKKGTTWATADYGATIPPMTNEDIRGMYYFQTVNRTKTVWRLQNSDMTYAFLDDEIVKDEIYTLIGIACGPLGLQYIDGTSATFGYFESGMTWGEWVNSFHNIDYYFDETGLTKDGNIYVASTNAGTLVKATEEVISALYYEYELPHEVELIHFLIDGIDYTAEKGMTWEEWTVSKYYTSDIIIFDSLGYAKLKNNTSLGIYKYNFLGAGAVLSSDIIEADWDYVVM